MTCETPLFQHVQVEIPVDFLSLAHHGCDLRDVYQAQGLMDYFGMLSGPTYLTLVRHFWVRAQLYDRKAEYLAARDEKLKTLGLENCDEYFIQKTAEIKQFAGSDEQHADEEA